MSVWGSVAVAAGTVIMGAVNNKAAGKAGAASNASNKDIAETPTRSTGIEQLLRELVSSTNEASTSEEQQQSLDKLLSDENFMKQFTNEVATQQAQETLNVTTKGDAGSQAALAGLIQGSGSGQEQVNAMVDQILRSGKADISNVGTRTGSFGSTTEQLLNNDLITKAAQAGVGMQNQLDAQKLEAIKAAQVGTTTEKGTAITDSTQASTGNEGSQTTQDQSRDTTSNVQQSTDKTTDTTSTDAQTSLSDTLVTPNDKVVPTGVLADLVSIGLSSADKTVGPSLDPTSIENISGINPAAGNSVGGQNFFPEGTPTSTPLTPDVGQIDALGQPVTGPHAVNALGVLDTNGTGGSVKPTVGTTVGGDRIGVIPTRTVGGVPVGIDPELDNIITSM
jgi:hypothetical protein